MKISLKKNLYFLIVTIISNTALFGSLPQQNSTEVGTELTERPGSGTVVTDPSTTVMHSLLSPDTTETNNLAGGGAASTCMVTLHVMNNDDDANEASVLELSSPNDSSVATAVRHVAITDTVTTPTPNLSSGLISDVASAKMNEMRSAGSSARAITSNRNNDDDAEYTTGTSSSSSDHLEPNKDVSFSRPLRQRSNVSYFGRSLSNGVVFPKTMSSDSSKHRFKNRRTTIAAELFSLEVAKVTEPLEKACIAIQEDRQVFSDTTDKMFERAEEFKAKLAALQVLVEQQAQSQQTQASYVQAFEERVALAQQEQATEISAIRDTVLQELGQANAAIEHFRLSTVSRQDIEPMQDQMQTLQQRVAALVAQTLAKREDLQTMIEQLRVEFQTLKLDPNILELKLQELEQKFKCLVRQAVFEGAARREILGVGIAQEIERDRLVLKFRLQAQDMGTRRQLEMMQAEFAQQAGQRNELMTQWELLRQSFQQYDSKMSDFDQRLATHTRRLAQLQAGIDQDENNQTSAVVVGGGAVATAAHVQSTAVEKVVDAKVAALEEKLLAEIQIMRDEKQALDDQVSSLHNHKVGLWAWTAVVTVGSVLLTVFTQSDWIKSWINGRA